MSDEEELFESESEDGDFSASEEEWLPTKNTKKGKAAETTIDDSEEGSQSEGEDENDPSEEPSDDEESPLVKKRGSRRNAPAARAKKKPTFATKKLFTKYKTPVATGESVGIPTSLNDIMKKAEYQTKRLTSSQKTSQSSDSESSGDDYLVDPKKLDLNSDFFKTSPTISKPSAVPKGKSLSDDSSSDGEEEKQEARAEKNLDKKSLMTKINQSSSKTIDLQEIHKKNMEFEMTKKRLQEARDKHHKSKKDDVNISQLLKMGEDEPSTSKEVVKPKKRKAESESDWESVDEEGKRRKLKQTSLNLFILRQKNWKINFLTNRFVFL